MTTFSMTTFSSLFLYTSLLLLLLHTSSNAATKSQRLKTYIIHLDHSHKPESLPSHESWHRLLLQSLTNPVEDEMLLYSYSHAMHGFSARLTPSQLSQIQKSPPHLATYPESFGKLFTTHSPQFLGLNQKSRLLSQSSHGQGVIIGIIDTGIWPESDSFHDRGMPSVPKRWKGKCEGGESFSPSLCNKKLIGARSFSRGLIAAGKKIDTRHDYNSTRDFDGHRTHTSSTAAGSHVAGVSHYGYAKGTARGIAPAAHVAMYKVWFSTDTDESAASDVLAGMEHAISDGLDIMSLSLGFTQTPYYNDVIAIASLSASERGIFVVCAAGNDGAYNSTHNGAPWITTVGAGTLDRNFTATLTLGNGFTFQGASYFPESIYITDAPLYYGKGNASKAICADGAFTGGEVDGKMVLCDSSSKIDVNGQKKVLEKAGAYGGIFITDLSLLGTGGYSIPMMVLSISSGALVKEYTTTATTPKVQSMSFGTTNFGTKPAPQVADFSSRGPDPINPSVLKPDILAPGVDILAAISPKVPVMQIGKYHWVSNYALFSGTSMAAPHVAGVAALLKNVHPSWSPTAIRSAIMTTAYTIDNTGTTLKDQYSNISTTPLSFGAGHINPNKAVDPGLIYDMGLQDYINFLCKLGYTNSQMNAVLRQNHWSCGQKTTELNYPSFMVIYSNNTSSSRVKTFERIVTNVGGEAAVYRATLEIPRGMKATVYPNTISFTQRNQKQHFYVSVEIDVEAPPVTYGYLKWTDQHKHVVTSPIVAVRH